jgi:hypothetical protein
MEKMSININLVAQEERKFKTFYLVLGSAGLFFLLFTFIWPVFTFSGSYLMWIAFIPGFIEAILYGLGKKRIFANNVPYLRMNEEQIERSKGGIFARHEIIRWADIKAIDLKLFEIQLTTLDNQSIQVDLTNLTDDNLKAVKEFVRTIQKNRFSK